MSTQRADNDFREFVVGFSDPLSRLAFLLTAGTSTGDPGDCGAATAHAATIDALAQVQRHWHDSGTIGAPEPVAVDALVGALPRLPRLRRPAGASVVEAPQVEASTAASVDDDIELLRAGLWRAWTTLAPRQRVPLLFVDVSVASRRLAGLDVPESFGRTRSRDVITASAVRDLKTSLLADSSTRLAVGSLGDDRLFELLMDVLREHASTTATPIDPYPVVASRVRQVRVRAALVVAVVVVLLGATTAVAVSVSKTTKTPVVRVSATLGGTLRPQPTQLAGVPVALTDRVIDWPARGTAAHDTDLLAQLEDSFGLAHPNATGVVQVLLATDTSAFRIAYVTANSPDGVIQSWFYGSPGSTDLVEGAWSYGGALVADASVLASAVVDTQGQAELVVIAPPTTSDMQLADFDFSKPAGPGFQPLPHEDGINTEPIQIESVSALILRVTVGANVLQSQNLPIVTLGPPTASGDTASFEPVPALPSVPAERSTPDPRVLALVVRAATAWHNSDAPGTPMRLSVLWAGTDEVGTRLVVARLKMRAFDALLFEWSNDAPDEGGQYLIDSKLPDAPMAFAYDGVDGTRIGVLAPLGANGSTSASVTSALVVPGEPQWGVEFDSSGFASLALPGVDSLINLSLNVDLLDNRGHLVEVVPVPPPA